MRFYVGQAFKTKKIALEHLLSFGKVMIHLDARRAGVDVPAHLAREAHLRLNLSYRFAANDLTITEQAASSSLSFQGQRHHCVLPFDAVFAMSIEQAEMYVWLPSIPSEMSAYFKSVRLEDPDHIADHILDGLPQKPKASPFKIIRGDAPLDAPPEPPSPPAPSADVPPEPATPPDAPPEPPKPKAPFLRIVK